MTKQAEQIAHNELVGGSQTSLHSHSGGGGADLKPYKVYDSTGGQTLTVLLTVNLDTEEISNANYSLSNDEITIVAAGTYLVSFHLGAGVAGTSGGTRGGIKAWVESDDGGSYVEVKGLSDRDYHREVSGLSSGYSATQLLVHANPNKKIRLRAEETYSNTDVDTIANETGISILKVA